jgi:hypothetical protein
MGGDRSHSFSKESHTDSVLGDYTYDMPAVQVLGPSGAWVPGFLLLATLPDGTALIRSSRTGQIRALTPDRWRDPLEAQDLATLAGEAGR